MLNDGIIKKEYQKNFKKLTILNAIIALAILLFVLVVLLSGDVKRLYASPVEVYSLSDIEENDLITIDSDYIYDLYYESLEGTKVVGYYGVVVLDDGYLMVLVDKKDQDVLDSENIEIKGKATALEPFENEMLDEIWEEIALEDPTVDKEYGISLYSTYKLEYGKSYTWIRIGSVVAILVSGYFIYRAISKFKDYKDYQNSKKYKKAIEEKGFSALEMQINNEYESGSYIAINKHSFITNSAIVILEGSNIIVQRVEDLVWIYKSITQHRTNGIPTGKTFAAIFAFKDGTRSTASIKKEADTDEILEQISKKYPHIAWGFSDELEAAYLAGQLNNINTQESTD